MRLLSELDQWRQQAPRKDARPFPQQNPDRVEATYLQAILIIIRPVLMGNPIDPALIKLCGDFAADACEVRSSPHPLYRTAINPLILDL